MKRCNMCVTPESYPGTSFNTDGVCNHCLNYQKEYKGWESGEAERKKLFEGILKSAKKRSTTYDALVPLSGGKDSTYCISPLKCLGCASYPTHSIMVSNRT